MTSDALDKLAQIQQQNQKRLGFKTSDYHKAVMKLYEENEEVILAQFRRIAWWQQQMSMETRLIYVAVFTLSLKDFLFAKSTWWLFLKTISAKQYQTGVKTLVHIHNWTTVSPFSKYVKCITCGKVTLSEVSSEQTKLEWNRWCSICLADFL